MLDERLIPDAWTEHVLPQHQSIARKVILRRIDNVGRATLPKDLAELKLEPPRYRLRERTAEALHDGAMIVPFGDRQRVAEHMKWNPVDVGAQLLVVG